MHLYHKDVYLPYVLSQPYNNVRLCLLYTDHAKREAKDEGIKLPLTAVLTGDMIVEIGVENGRVEKVVYRMSYDNERDISMVFAIPSWYIKTVWLNNKNDIHTTLDRSKYEVEYA